MGATTLALQATLELDSRDFEKIDAWPMEELQGRIWECLEVSLPVSLRRGQMTVRGTLRFVVPTPYELKQAREK